MDPDTDDDATDRMSIAGYTLLGIFSFVAVVGNGFVFWAFCIDKRLRTNSNLFILSLAVADFLMGIISIPVYMVLHISPSNVLGDQVCKISAFLDNSLVIVSMWTLFLTSIDRYLVIVYPHLYRKFITQRSSLLLIASVWFMSVTVASLPLLGWNSYEHSGNTCSIGDKQHPYFKVFFFLTFPVPLVTIVFCYVWITIKTNLIHARANKDCEGRRKSVTNARSVTRVTVMVLALVIAHIVLTMPALIINLIQSFNPELVAGVSEVTADVVILMFFANAAVNPVLYGAFNTNFQRSFQLCPCAPHTSPPQALPAGSSSERLRKRSNFVFVNEVVTV